MKIVSACLLGIRCRYDGGSAPCDKVIELAKKGEAVPVCPEQLGGLPTPRDCAERTGKRLLTKEGEDVTEQFLRGAEEALGIARILGAKEAILKSKSPSCGAGKIYDGTFSGKLTKGNGIFAELLIKNNIRVVTDEDI